MIASRKYRVALVGCGHIAETGHLPSLLRHARFELAALCDIRAERAALLSEKAGGVAMCSDYRELLGRKDIDAVILALHPKVNVEAAVAFLRHGKAVLAEKPLASSLDEGLRLEREIAAVKGVYQVGFVFRYVPLVKKVAEIAREIGTPAIYDVEIYDERLDRGNAEHVRAMQTCFSNTSILNYEGSHLFDYFAQWNPSPWVRAHATALKTDPAFGGPNLWDAQLILADGSLLHFEVGALLPDLPDCRFRISGPRGWMELNIRTGAGRWGRESEIREIRTEPIAQDWAKQLDVFAEAIDAGGARSSTVKDGLRALTAAMACEQSCRTGAAVNIESIH